MRSSYDFQTQYIYTYPQARINELKYIPEKNSTRHKRST